MSSDCSNRTSCALQVAAARSASSRPRMRHSGTQARDSVSSFPRSSSIAGFGDVSNARGRQHLVTHLVDRRRCCRDQLGKRASSFGGQLRREVADFVQLRCCLPKLGQRRLGRGDIRDARQHGPQGADGRVQLVRQVHPANRQIRRRHTHGPDRGLRRGSTRHLGDRFAVLDGRGHTRQDRPRRLARPTNRATAMALRWMPRKPPDLRLRSSVPLRLPFGSRRLKPPLRRCASFLRPCR